MTFHDYTVTVSGEVRSHREHDSALLARAAVEVFARLLDQGAQFRCPVHPEFPHVELEWSEEPGGALARFYAHGELLTVSFLTTEEDPRAMSAFLA